MMDRLLGTIETRKGRELIWRDSGWFCADESIASMVTSLFGKEVPQDYLPDAVERQLKHVANFIGGKVSTVDVPAIPQVGDVVC